MRPARVDAGPGCWCPARSLSGHQHADRGGAGHEVSPLAVNRALRLWRFDSAPHHHLAPVAQWTEQRPPKPMRAGSTHAGGTGATFGPDRAVVVNSADTSVFQTEAAGSMPADRSTRSTRGRWDCWLGRHPFKAEDRDRYPDRLRTKVHAPVAQVEQSATLRTSRSQVRVLVGVRAGGTTGRRHPAHVAQRQGHRIVGCPRVERGCS